MGQFFTAIKAAAACNEVGSQTPMCTSQRNRFKRAVRSGFQGFVRGVVLSGRDGKWL